MENVKTAEQEPFERDPRKSPDVHKEVTIIVNGRQRRYDLRTTLSFSELVLIAFPNTPAGTNIYYTVNYRHGPSEKPQASLIDGDTIRLSDGMIFNVTATDKS